ncbi:MAG TPA: hypothetical protein VGS28_03255 [Candidatus Saccharimonadales bacterium]|nr:hypothetical protein [Candidatus Saccharimonadales bacterium]
MFGRKRKQRKDNQLSNKLLSMAVGTVSGSNLKRALTQRDLIAKESEIGRHLFGPIPKGHTREFFCLDEYTWIWYESWTDTRTGKRQECTTRYEIHPNVILKIQDGQPYQEVTDQELHNLAHAIRQYTLRVARDVYKRPFAEAVA